MSETVLDGAVVPFDPKDARVLVFDWDTDALATSVAIASSEIQVIGIKPAGLAISSITRVGTTATVTTEAAHGLATGASVTIAGAAQKEYNVTATITVTSTTAFTFTVSGSPTTPATTTDALTYSQGLGVDNDSILSAAGYDSRWTQLRLVAAGETYIGRKYEVANKITTNESPTQTFERSFFVTLENL